MNPRLEPGHSWDSIDLERKVKPPRHSQKWSYSYHLESIGKALSSAGIRYHKMAHINSTYLLIWRIQYRSCERGSNTTPRPKGQHNDERCISHQPSDRKDTTNGEFPTKVRSFCLALAAGDPSTSLCKKLFPAIEEWLDRLVSYKEIMT
ncbi:hypothetical protein [Absidia glauca]|uniref:Ndc10 domain-containing protein n=1 Tax=Absidia glauca TaxID=4829 RepID=A0A168R9S6_ABSGL|nr:hypothetical protein [Absidia glauca]